MGPIEKLRTRTEWQAYLFTVAIILADVIFDLGIDKDHLIALVTSTGGYGLSRGLGKRGTDVAIAPAPAAPSSVVTETGQK